MTQLELGNIVQVTIADKKCTGRIIKFVSGDNCRVRYFDALLVNMRIAEFSCAVCDPSDKAQIDAFLAVARAHNKRINVESSSSRKRRERNARRFD